MKFTTYIFVLASVILCQSEPKHRRRLPGTGHLEAINFNCPEDFGYYAHETDCSKYYVCVFGGALLESCTGGLVYSDELQTCDWPRNAVCNKTSDSTFTTFKITDRRTQSPVAVTSGQPGLETPNRNEIPLEEQRRPSPYFIESNQRQFSQDTYSSAADGEIGQRGPRTYRNSDPRQLDERVGRSRGSLVNHQFSSAPSTPSPVVSARPPPHPVRGSTTDYDPYYNYTDPNYYYDYYENYDYTLDGTISANQNSGQSRPSPSTTTRPKTVLGSRFINQSKAPTLFTSHDLRERFHTTLNDISSTPSIEIFHSTTARPNRFHGSTTSELPPRFHSTNAAPAPTTQVSVSRNRRPSAKPASAILQRSSSTPIDIFRSVPARPASLYPQPPYDQKATRCTPEVCQLPDCYCGGRNVPGGYQPEEIPQIVLLTFDDAVNDLNKELYRDFFEKGRTNPNGCPIQATFYVSHEWTDYGQVQNLYADGHEIASHSVSHSFGEQFSEKRWAEEIDGQRDILAAYGGVLREDIRGMRAPFLSVGGNRMFKMLYDYNFTYDSSMPVYENNPPSFPYTFDYKIFHDCMIPPCPINSYPGLWEMPMVMWQDLRGGRCSMVDGCSAPSDAEGIYKMLTKNFERHYTTSRAPLGLFFHAAWFTQAHHKEGFIAFLDTITNMDDVWLVTNWQAIQWMRDPTPLSHIKSFKPFECDYPERPGKCNRSKVCNLWHKSGVRYMNTCQSCPDYYPWTGKTGVPQVKNTL